MGNHTFNQSSIAWPFCELFFKACLICWWWAGWYELKYVRFSFTFCEYILRQCPWLTVLSVFGLLLNVYLIPRITDYPSRRADKHIFQGFCFQSSVFWMEGFVLSLDKFHFISYHPPSSHHQLMNQAIKKGSQNGHAIDDWLNMWANVGI